LVVDLVTIAVFARAGGGGAAIARWGSGVLAHTAIGLT
jgi:hypothetical protein